MEAIEEPIPLTASQIAIEHFTRELLAHSETSNDTETVVLLHDACYGHRYSRLKTSKSTLSMIVERPERIHASVLGASTAYVRLGGHHAGGRNAPHPEVVEAAPPPFRIRRTKRTMDITSPCVIAVHGNEWMTELQSMCSVAGERLAAGAKELARDGTGEQPAKRKLHEGDLYLCSESLDAFQGALGGVADAIDTVFASTTSTKRAFVAVRPPGHHCAADFPSGFCWLNNVHVGIEYAAQTYGLTHAAILDFDLHHGDGSQAIAWQRNSKNNEKRLAAKPNSKLRLNPDIGYYSLHDINSYPCELGDDEKVQAASLCIDNAHGQSIWNVHLEEWKTIDDFWKLYEQKYRVLIDKARAFLRHHSQSSKKEGKVAPKAAIFISAGFDASEWEGAGMQRHKVNVPTEFYARFTRDVVELAAEEDCACDGRVVSVLEGGYSDRALCSGVLSHLSGLCATPAQPTKSQKEAAMRLDQMLRGLAINGNSRSGLSLRYDESWWSESNLTALELKVNPPPPPGPAKKVRVGKQPTYATPTESFAYKVVDTDKFARSISGTMRDVAQPIRPPTPPAPEVNWIVATHELSKLLIPTDRSTHSCTPEELAGPKIQKPRVSGVVPVAADVSAMPRQLRDRKAKVPGYPMSSHSDEMESVRSVSRNSRRQTIADLPLSEPNPAQAAPRPLVQERRASRRLSAGSALSSVSAEVGATPPPVPALPATTKVNSSRMPPPPAPTGMQVKKVRPAPTAVAGARTKKAAIAGAPNASPTRSKIGITPAPIQAASTTLGMENQGRPVHTAELATNGTANGGDDVDGLTSGMKRISIKVGTKEEHDRKQKERLDADRRARALKAAETRRTNAAAKKAAAAGASNAPTPLALATSAEPAPVAIVKGLAELREQHIDRASNSAETDTSAAAIAEIAVTEPEGPYTQPVPTANEAAIEPPSHLLSVDGQQMPKTPNGGSLAPPEQAVSTAFEIGTPVAVPPAETGITVPDSAARQLLSENYMANVPARPLAETYSSPAISKLSTYGGPHFPVWSSTGPIPFGKPSTSSPINSVKKNDEQASVPSVVDDAKGAINSFVNANGLGKEEQREGKNSIWDVPETPHR